MKQNSSKALWTVAILLIMGASLLSSCSPQAATPPTPSPTSVAKLTLDALRNAAYQSEFPASKKAKLTDGAYEEEIVPGAASKLTIRLSDQVAYGDVNGDGADDAAVLLLSNAGGSGTFVHLAVVINDKGTPRHVASALLGDRVQIKSLAIQASEITLPMIAHGPKDPMCCPTQEVTRTFRLEEGALKLVSEVKAAPTPSLTATTTLGIEPRSVLLDTQGLPYSYQPNRVAATPYDASQPPGPKGLPEHIQINFGVVDPKDRKFGDPIMYIIPVDEYRQLWEQGGNMSVTKMFDKIESLAQKLPSPLPTSAMPALPYEEIVGRQDLAVQIAHPGVTEKSAIRSGFRYVGRFMQDPNPVSKEPLRYIYLGFTEEGNHLVAFFYPVTTGALPAIQDVPATEFDRVVTDHKAYMQEKADMLNKLAGSEWKPDLAKLDALVASLTIKPR